MRAIKDYQGPLKEHEVTIFVRRGGPNYQEGLRVMGEVGKCRVEEPGVLPRVVLFPSSARFMLHVVTVVFISMFIIMLSFTNNTLMWL